MSTPAKTPAAADWGRRLLMGALIALVMIVALHIGQRVFRDHFTIEQTTRVVSHVDGLTYRVHEGHPGFQRAADTLAALNKRTIDLLRYLRKKYAVRPYPNDGSLPPFALHPARAAAVRNLLRRYNPDNLAENSPDDPSKDTSYVQDKGSIVAICLRERGSPNNPIHNLDMLTFVTLHEMSHIAIDDIDHPGPSGRPSSSSSSRPRRAGSS